MNNCARVKKHVKNAREITKKPYTVHAARFKVSSVFGYTQGIRDAERPDGLKKRYARFSLTEYAENSEGIY